jgi:hypothetical protein
MLKFIGKTIQVGVAACCARAANGHGGLGKRMRLNQVIFLPHRSRSSRSTAMLLRLLRLFVFAAAPVILVASPARAAPEKVQYSGDAKPGTIVVHSGERSLYLITGKDQALKYPVGVGRALALVICFSPICRRKSRNFLICGLLAIGGKRSTVGFFEKAASKIDLDD